MRDDLIRLNASDLYSKWGFSDGDVLRALYEAQVIKNDYHSLLFHLAQKYLLPLCPKEMEILRYQSCHNPCRVSDDCCNRYPNLEWDVDDIYVDIPISLVMKEDALLDFNTKEG